jgi:hypothetical protein
LAGKVIMTSINSLPIKGYNSEPVPNTFFKQDEETKHGAIIFPGLGYTAHMPLLFYSRELMLSLKADVLTVEYDYNSRNFLALDGRERMQLLFADVKPAFNALLKQRDYKQITFIGKSLGTRAMGHLLTNDPLPATVNAVWLTPLLKDSRLRDQMKQFKGRSLFISGTADPHYDAEYMKGVQEATNGRVVLVGDGDHSLNIKDDIIRSIQELEKVIGSIKTFIAE